MRIDKVKAVGFGPFTDDELDLAPGMNVVYGPNESGKSSWHAAIYVAMCGMKRTKGQPSREDRAFARRHRPWRGGPWRVVGIITLDDGSSIEIEQRLGPGGGTAARDHSTKRPWPDDLVRAGAVDASTLLGLTREAALATLFVRQADMLRVLEHAEGLQEYLERAAATSAVDTTADEALARIKAYKQDRVGCFGPIPRDRLRRRCGPSRRRGLSATAPRSDSRTTRSCSNDATPPNRKRMTPIDGCARWSSMSTSASAASAGATSAS